MCKYCHLQILTPTDISTLLLAHTTVQETQPDLSLAQQLALVARNFQEQHRGGEQLTSGASGSEGEADGDGESTATDHPPAALPSNWDWRKLGQVLQDHGVVIPLPHFKGLR
jgi:hypothetical protein